MDKHSRLFGFGFRQRIKSFESAFPQSILNDEIEVGRNCLKSRCHRDLVAFFKHLAVQARLGRLATKYDSTLLSKAVRQLGHGSHIRLRVR